MKIALGRHQFHMIAESKAVLHFDFGEPVTLFAGQLTDKLLALRDRAAVQD
jgi:hypothetical protein